MNENTITGKFVFSAKSSKNPFDTLFFETGPFERALRDKEWPHSVQKSTSSSVISAPHFGQ